MMKNKRRGFTVVELVIIIAVVAILAAVLIPTYVNLVKKSNEANAQVEAKNLISEMLTDIILGKEGDADLLVFSEKGSNVYAYAYSRTEGKIISYKEQFSNTTTFEGTVEAAIGKMLSDGAIRDLNVPEDDWRHPANVIKIVDSLSVNGKMIVYANYEVIADVFETHVHTWETAWTFDGTHHWHKCVGCDEITGKAEHDWESKTENNVKTDTCKVCHATKTEVISGDKTHHLFHHVAKAATCTEAGNIEYWECVDEGCGKYFSDSEAKNEITDKNSVKIPAKGHTPVPDAAVAATCIKSGLTAGTHCSVCHKVITPQMVTPTTAHKEDIIAGKAATCTATGLTEGKKCSVCGKVLVEQAVIPVKEHTPVVVAGKEATCTETGLTEGKKCSVCGKVLVERTVIPVKEHTPVVVAGKEATCTATGLTEGKKCSVCGKVLVEQKVISAGHKEVTIPGNEATCAATGLTEGKKCSVCGTVLVAQEEIPMTLHAHYGYDENGNCKKCGMGKAALHDLKRTDASGEKSITLTCDLTLTIDDADTLPMGRPSFAIRASKDGSGKFGTTTLDLNGHTLEVKVETSDNGLENFARIFYGNLIIKGPGKIKYNGVAALFKRATPFDVNKPYLIVADDNVEFIGIKDGKEVPLNKETECKGKMYADFFYTHPDFGKHAFLSNGKCVNCDATRPNP